MSTQVGADGAVINTALETVTFLAITEIPPHYKEALVAAGTAGDIDMIEKLEGELRANFGERITRVAF